MADRYSIDALATEAPPPERVYGIDALQKGDGSEIRSTTAKPRSVQDSLEGSASFFTTMRASLAPKVEDQIKRFAAARFPDEYKADPERVLKRYGVMDGNIVYADDKGEVHREVPSSFDNADSIPGKFMRVGRFVASQVGPSAPQAAAALAGTATAEASPVASISAAAGAATATDLFRQALDRILAGEDPTDVSLLNSLGHGAEAAFGQGIGVGGARLLSRNELAVKPFDRMAAKDPAFQQQVADIQKLAKDRYGIDLSAGQATQMRSLLAEERRLGRYPETADKMADFAENQRRVQVPAAVNQELDRVAPNRGGEAAVEQFRQGANEVVGQAVKDRSTAARAAYAKALDDRPGFYTEALGEILKRPSAQEAWKKAQRLAADEGRDLPKLVTFDESGAVKIDPTVTPDWRAWDYIKKGLDQVVSENTNAMTGTLSPQGRAASNLRSQILEILDRVNPDYKAARAVYGDASDAVNAVLEGGVGLLKRMQGPERQQMVNTIFSGNSLMPEEVARMRSQFNAAGRLEDWNQGVRQYLSGKLDAAMKTENVPQYLYKNLWQDPAQRRVLEVAIGDKGLVEGWTKLFDVLDRARKSLPEGAPTATDMPAMMGPQTVGKGLRIFGKAASPQTWLNLGNEAVEAIDALRTPEARIKLADAMLSGGTAEKLKRLRMLPPAGEKTAVLASQILAEIGLTASGARTPNDRPISALEDRTTGRPGP